MIARRTFIKRASMVAIAATASTIGRQSRGQQVSNSAGTEAPKLKAPEGACDCHMHIYDAARFPMPPSTRVPPSNATVSHYRLLQKRIGTTRVVVVQPRNYAIDNRVTVDAIAQLGPNARGVAVLHPTVTDAELKALHAAGVRGIRFTLGDPATAVVKVDMIEPLAKRVAHFGWQLSQCNPDFSSDHVGINPLLSTVGFEGTFQRPQRGHAASARNLQANAVLADSQCQHSLGRFLVSALQRSNAERKSHRL